jgi:hypothetical protein
MPTSQAKLYSRARRKEFMKLQWCCWKRGGGARNPVNMDISLFPQRIRALITVGGDSFPGITAIRMPPPARS